MQELVHIFAFFSDDRPFDIFLSYSISTENKTDTKGLMDSLHGWFDLNKFRVFDQHRSHAGGMFTKQSKQSNKLATVRTICRKITYFQRHA